MRAFHTVFLAAAFLVLPRSAPAQDLVTNGHFHTDIIGWTLQGSGSEAWDPLDFEGNPSSGSLRVTSTVTGPPESTSSRQCIALNPSGTYELGGRIRFPSVGQAGHGVAAIGLAFYSNTACSGTPLSQAQTPIVSSQTTDIWTDVFVNGLSLGSGTMAVAVFPFVGMIGGTSLPALFDRVRFGHDGTTPVESQTFLVE